MMGSAERMKQPPSVLPSGHGHNVGSPTGIWRSKAGLALIGFLLIGGFLLVSEHRLHALGYLPYLLVLACPLLHVFHGGHGGHQHRSSSDQSAKPRDG